MLTTADILRRYPAPRCQTAADYKRGVSESFRRARAVAVNAAFIVDNGGDCLVCGNASPCPGWHTTDEVDAIGKELEQRVPIS